MLPLLLWLLIATGPGWVIAAHHPRRRQWAVVAFVAGVVAMLFPLGWLLFALLTGPGPRFALDHQRRRAQSPIAASFD